MDLSIIIVTYNSLPYLDGCLGAIGACGGGLSLEVVVVDNHSGDGTVAYVAEKYPYVRVIENDANVGFTRANNLGIAASQGEKVLLLNPDTEVGPGALEAMVAHLEAHPSLAVVGCRLLNTDGTTQYSWRRDTSLLSWAAVRIIGAEPLLMKRHVDRMDAARRRTGEGEGVAVSEIMGACLMTRRDIIEQVGGLDEQIFMSLEDTEFCWRVANAGWGIEYLPHVTVLHFGGASSRLNRGAALTAYYRSEVYFVGLSRGRVAALLHRGFVLVECAVKGLVTVCRMLLLGGTDEKPRLRAYECTIRLVLGFDEARYVPRARSM